MKSLYWRRCWLLRQTGSQTGLLLYTLQIPPWHIFHPAQFESNRDWIMKHTNITVITVTWQLILGVLIHCVSDEWWVYQWLCGLCGWLHQLPRPDPGESGLHPDVGWPHQGQVPLHDDRYWYLVTVTMIWNKFNFSLPGRAAWPGVLVTHGGLFRFVKTGPYKDMMYWRCSDNKSLGCSARATTKVEEEEVTENGQVSLVKRHVLVAVSTPQVTLWYFLSFMFFFYYLCQINI